MNIEGKLQVSRNSLKEKMRGIILEKDATVPTKSLRPPMKILGFCTVVSFYCFRMRR